MPTTDRGLRAPSRRSEFFASNRDLRCRRRAGGGRARPGAAGADRRAGAGAAVVHLRQRPVAVRLDAGLRGRPAGSVTSSSAWSRTSAPTCPGSRPAMSWWRRSCGPTTPATSAGRACRPRAGTAACGARRRRRRPGRGGAGAAGAGHAGEAAGRGGLGAAAVAADPVRRVPDRAPLRGHRRGQPAHDGDGDRRRRGRAVRRARGEAARRRADHPDGPAQGPHGSGARVRRHRRRRRARRGRRREGPRADRRRRHPHRAGVRRACGRPSRPRTPWSAPAARSAGSALPSTPTCRPTSATFLRNITLTGGVAPPGPTSRSCCPTCSTAPSQPGKVFDRTVDLDGVPDGYRAMADREALKVMVRP